MRERRWSRCNTLLYLLMQRRGRSTHTIIHTHNWSGEMRCRDNICLLISCYTLCGFLNIQNEKEIFGVKGNLMNIHEGKWKEGVGHVFCSLPYWISLHQRKNKRFFIINIMRIHTIWYSITSLTLIYIIETTINTFCFLLHLFSLIYTHHTITHIIPHHTTLTTHTIFILLLYKLT